MTRHRQPNRTATRRPDLTAARDAAAAEGLARRRSDAEQERARETLRVMALLQESVKDARASRGEDPPA